MQSKSMQLYVFDPDSEPNANRLFPVAGFRPTGADVANLRVTVFGPDPALPSANVGQMGNPIDLGDTVEQGLNTRSLMYAQDTDDIARTLGTATLGSTTLPTSLSVRRGLNTNASLYAYDADAATGTLQALRTRAAIETVTPETVSLMTVAQLYAFDGTNQIAAQSASADNLGTTDATGSLMTQNPGEWTITHSPAANTTATATKAAGAAGVRHVLKSISADLIGVGAIAAPIDVVVRDGAAGVGAVLWNKKLFAPAANSKDEFALAPLNIIGSEATAMTVEFAAGPGANNFEVVSATGVSVGQKITLSNSLTMQAGIPTPADDTVGFIRPTVTDPPIEGSITAGDEDNILGGGMGLTGIFYAGGAFDQFTVFVQLDTQTGNGPAQNIWTRIEVETEVGLRTFNSSDADTYDPVFGDGSALWTFDGETTPLFVDGNSYDFTIFY